MILPMLLGPPLDATMWQLGQYAKQPVLPASMGVLPLLVPAMANGAMLLAHAHHWVSCMRLTNIWCCPCYVDI